MRTKRIIAVFGGSENPSPEVQACAKRLGSALSGAGYILLTGGTGSGGPSVKDCAIAGSNCWVGVGKAGPADARPQKGGLAIRTGLGYKRNYLEASMCDAAIVLPGGDGTVSELTSALSLNRPVAFVGEWRAAVDLDAADRPAVLEGIAERTQALFARSAPVTEIDPFVTKEALCRALGSLPSYQYFELSQAADAVEWIESVVPGPFAGTFLPIAGLEHVKESYETWVQQAPETANADGRGPGPAATEPPPAATEPPPPAATAGSPQQQATRLKQRPAMSTAGRRAVGIWIVSLSALALVHLPWAWALAERLSSKPTGVRDHWLGWVFTPQKASILLLVVILSAVIGSCATLALTFAHRAGYGSLEKGWGWWYVTRPFTASGIGVLAFALLQAGFFGSNKATSSGLLAAVAIGGLAGLFTDQLLQKMRTALGLTAFLKSAADPEETKKINTAGSGS